MPFNSFDDYPMSWRPGRAELYAPIYQSLADLLEQDIRSGALPAGTKLPPQRELADFLDLNPSTVTKAYKLCEVRGLVHAVVGRGTFISPNANVPTSIVEKNADPEIEMATIHPFYVHNQLVRDVAMEVLARPESEALFEYSHPLGNQDQVRTGAAWLRQFGLPADEKSTLIAAGVQNALAILLSTLFEAGDRIAVDPYTYANFIGMANLLHLQLAAVEGDEEGMRPDLLDSLCANQKVQGVYLMPTGANPTNRAISPARKRELAKVIRRRGLIALEDDNFAAILEETPAPLALELPEDCIYISGLSKPLCPGLRVAFLHVPERFRAPLEQGALHQNLKISSLNIEIAAELIRRGLDRQIVREKRELSIRRNRIYREVFPDMPCHPVSYCQWLPLPEGCTGQQCEAALARQGVGVFGAERFAVGTQTRRSYIRVATCSPKDEEKLRRGLEILRQYHSAP